MAPGALFFVMVLQVASMPWSVEGPFRTAEECAAAARQAPLLAGGGEYPVPASASGCFGRGE